MLLSVQTPNLLAKVLLSLPPVERRFLKRGFLEALNLQVQGPPIAFQARVVPMGWNWAVHFIQAAHLNILGGVLTGQPWLTDKVPSERLSGQQVAKVLYIDNVAAIGVDPLACEDTLEAMLHAFEKRGIVAHRDEMAGDTVELLGFELTKCRTRWRPTRKKFWRLAGAPQFALERGACVSGRELRLVGHIVSVLLLKRELLSVLCSTYTFMSRSYERRQPLWRSVRAELQMCWDLLPVVTAEMDGEWSQTAHAYDAALTGFGVCRSTWNASEVAAEGTLKELARFRGPLAQEVAPREAALGLTSYDLSAEAEPPPFGNFAEVSPALLDRHSWRVVAAKRFRRKDRILNLEAAALVFTVRSIARVLGSQHKRHLLLGDNMSVICAPCKGRAAHFQLLRACRVIAATSVAAELRCYHRWIPSERNPADGPSRRFEPRRPHGVGGDPRPAPRAPQRPPLVQRQGMPQKSSARPASTACPWRLSAFLRRGREETMHPRTAPLAGRWDAVCARLSPLQKDKIRPTTQEAY